MLARELTGKPLVAHIHATEYDRSGLNINEQVAGIERAGLNAADVVVAVSRLTRKTVIDRYGVPPEKVVVVHNAVARHEAQRHYLVPQRIRHEKRVLFLGRVTFQKGPEYFMAGTGRDIYSNLRSINPANEAAALNITAKWSLEGASAREADVFTTVSPITGEESSVLLGRQPDVITTNGLDMRLIPDYSVDRSRPAEHRERIVEAANRFLRCQLPGNTRIFAISGRYEMHNKGVDIFLEALARVEQSLAGTDASILALCLVMGGHTGVNTAAVSGEAGADDNGLPFICTHYAWNAPQDPIINACRRLGLNNRAENRVKVIFVPAMEVGKA
jgi:Glycosyltransferase